MLKFIVNTVGEAEVLYNDSRLFSFSSGISDKSVNYTNMEMTGNQTVYHFDKDENKLVWNYGQIADDYLSISGQYALDYKPYSVNPFLNAKIEVEGIFRQGFGIGGPTGYLARSAIRRSEEFKSYGLIALRFKQGYLIIYAADCTKYTCQFNVDFENKKTETMLLTCSYKIENCYERDTLPELQFIFAQELETGLRQAAEAIAKPLAPVLKAPAYHWCSWYYCYNNFDMTQLKELLDGFESVTPKPEIDVIQIDAGYCPSPGDWLDAFYTFPGGLEEAFSLIRSRGYKAGIWISPYMVGNRSKLYSEHPDWVLTYSNGEKITPWRFYNEPKVWANQDEEYYVLDTSNEHARKYILHVFAELKRMGADFFKTDFMLWGMQESCDILRKNPGKTSVEYYREFMSDLQKVIGDSYWLGCIAPFLPMLGFVNGMRIARDIGAKWDGETFSARSLIQEIAGDSYFNGVYWQNDPDAVLLRDYHIFLNENEIRSLALLQAVSGGAVYTSEFMHKLPQDRLDLFHFIKPSKIMRPDIPFIDKNEKIIAMHHKLDDRHIILLFNPLNEDIMFSYEVKSLTGVDSLYLKNHNTGEASSGRETAVHGKLAAHGCLLLFGSEQSAITQTIDNIWNW